MQSERMREVRVRKLILAALVSALLVGAGVAQADTIVSGDTNIVDGLAGPQLDSGNEQFFANVLGGGSTVLVQDGWGSFDTLLNNYYNGLSGVSSAALVGSITSTALSGVDVFFSVLPSAAYTASEISAMAAFEASGGTLVFLGDNDSAVPTRNGYINSALSTLGSALGIQNATLDTGFHTATGAQIAVHALTTGVSTFTYAATSAVTSVSGGEALFYTTNGTAFVAVEVSNPVPEPATLALFGLGAGALALRRRRRKLA